MRRLIIDSLRYWVQEMHVDGFRFDLASVLTRGAHGEPLPNPPIIWDIDTDPALAGTKLIAEAWDAAGLYQVGAFVGDFWKEWNGKFRDDVRSFVKSDNGYVAGAGRAAGRQPGRVRARHSRAPEKSVNFITVHDGFTLNDLVSYNEKHNEANGEDNRDGVERQPQLELRRRGADRRPGRRSAAQPPGEECFTLLLVAVGAPLIQMGDEVRRTQQGNNNAYCQDNAISWFDWTLLDKHADVHRFVKQLIAARLGAGDARTDDDTLWIYCSGCMLSITGSTLARPTRAASHSLAISRTSADGTGALYLMVNAYWEPLDFALPPAPAAARRAGGAGSTPSLPSPEDIYALRDAPGVTEGVYQVGPRSVVALVALTDQVAAQT